MLDRVYTNVNCCGIELAFNGVSTPSIITGWQPFYNEIFQNADFQKTYASIASINFSEASAILNGNTYFKQKVEFRLPHNDKNRAERIALLHKIKFVKVLLNDGKALVIGTNDVFQNTPPLIKTENNEQTLELTLEVQSIKPAGFTPVQTAYGLPALIPLSF